MAGNESTAQRVGRLLVVEPEALLRWSLVTYLGRWFEVLSAETRLAAERILDHYRVDALVLSDELSEPVMKEIEERARSYNTAARVVRTVTTERIGQVLHDDTCWIEKPFELAKLAALLGVPPSNASAVPD